VPPVAGNGHPAPQSRGGFTQRNVAYDPPLLHGCGNALFGLLSAINEVRSFRTLRRHSPAPLLSACRIGRRQGHTTSGTPTARCYCTRALRGRDRRAGRRSTTGCGGRDFGRSRKQSCATVAQSPERRRVVTGLICRKARGYRRSGRWSQPGSNRRPPACKAAPTKGTPGDDRRQSPANGNNLAHACAAAPRACWGCRCDVWARIGPQHERLPLGRLPGASRPPRLRRA
jgi:hypothetical protein